MVNYPVFPVLASISIPATAFPSPGHVPEITYRLFAQLPRLAARSTSFSSSPHPRPPICFPVLLLFFLFSFRFSSFVGPFAGRSRPPTCPFVQLPKTVYDFEDYVRDLEFPRATSPFFPSSLSPFFSLDSTLWIKTSRLLTFSPSSGDHRRTRVELEKYARTYNVSLRSHFVKT